MVFSAKNNENWKKLVTTKVPAKGQLASLAG